MSAPRLSDEQRHEPDGELLWNESYYFDFAADDGSLGGYVRVGLYPNLGVVWYWACLVGEGRDLVTVIDHEVPLPSGDKSLELRTTGLWADHTCETPLDHFSLGLEAFGVGLADPTEVYRSMRGEQVPMGFDLEWETDGAGYAYPAPLDRYEIPCVVHGEVLVGDEQIEFSGHGQRDHSWGVRDWWTVAWCWVAGWLDDGTRFQGTTILTPGIDWAEGYTQVPSGGPAALRSYSVTHRTDGEGIPVEIGLEIDGLELRGDPVGWAPVLLVAPDGRESRFARGLVRLEHRDGRRGAGWIEFNQPPT